MPSWHTRLDNYPTGAPGDAALAGAFMWSLAKVARTFGIPAAGTRWGTRRFGADTVVFAEWTIDDEIAGGLYDDQ